MQLQEEVILNEFRSIPGVGKSIAKDLYRLGYRSVAELKKENPEQMYAACCTLEGQPIDRCLLYVFRCAVYFASHTKHDSHLLKWWNWKDKK